jgi:hypothetical protein
MRIIHHMDDDQILINRIAGEMFNIEAGKCIYTQGVENLDPKIRNMNYPIYKVSGGKVSIRASYGVLFLPEINNQTLLIGKLSRRIIEISAKYEADMKQCHLKTHSTLETGSEHFTVVRAKNNLHGTDDLEHDTGSFPQRKFILSPTALNKKNTNIGDGARFIWFIYNIDDLLRSVENYTNPFIEPITQFVGILYDKNNIFTFTDGQLVSEQITFKYTRLGSKYKDILYMGETSPKLIDSLKEKIKELTPPPSTQTMNEDGTSTVSVSSNISSEKQNLERELSSLVSIYNDNYMKPEFVLSSYLGSSSLMICPVRRGAFEIIRHLGKWSLYQYAINISFQSMVNTVYEVNFRDIIINNSLRVPNIHNDICSHCQTPLYDDIYVVFTNTNSREGVAICPTCMHSTFDYKHGTENFQQINDGKILYSPTEIVARTKYPRTVSSIIDQLQIDKIVKDILNLSFLCVSIEIMQSSRALYIGINENAKVLPKKYFIAWYGPIYSYISTYANKKYAKKRKFSKKFPNIFENAIIFSANILNP